VNPDADLWHYDQARDDAAGFLLYEEYPDVPLKLPKFAGTAATVDRLVPGRLAPVPPPVASRTGPAARRGPLDVESRSAPTPSGS
jgi:hypothetical protein